MWLKLLPLVLSSHRSRCSARKEAFSRLSVQHPITATTKTADCALFWIRFPVISLVSVLPIGAQYSHWSAPEACCDVTQASTECNGAVARSRRISDVIQALMECKWRRRRRGLGSILLQKVRSCCALTILYKTYSTVGRSIASI